MRLDTCYWIFLFALNTSTFFKNLQTHDYWYAGFAFALALWTGFEFLKTLEED